MPTSKLQAELLLLLASQRDPESFIAGGVPINRIGPRISADIDIFHDRQERVQSTALSDAKIIEGAGYRLQWIRQQPTMYSAAISSRDEQTKLEWVVDSDFRFFPAVPDDEYGYVLHMADLAVNKAMAAAGRREARDIVDLVTLDRQFLSLGAIVWAAIEIAPGFTPEGLIAEISRNSRYPAQDFAELEATQPIDAAAVMQSLRAAIAAANAFVAQMPSDKAGRLFLKDGVPVEPDPKNLSAYTEHSPQRRGHWPSSPEISSAMLDRYVAQRQDKPADEPGT